MRTHGWGGRPPADDDEAIDRIVAAARDCIDRKGASTSITDVAESLRVTRQTVYRYFASTEDLLQATALRGVGDFMDRLASGAGAGRDPGAVVVDLVASALEQLPTEPTMGLLLTADRAGTFARGITSPTAMAFGRAIFERVDVDWAAVGLTGRLFDEFLEQVLRTIQSLVLDPGPARSGVALRSYLDRWLWAPAVHAARSAAGGDPAPGRPEGGGRTRSRAR